MLRNSTNPIEYKMYPFIKRYFPNYEIFWDDYLSDGIGNDNHWIKGEFERLGITNYGILKSLNFIRIKYDKIEVNDENQTFKNIYYHFGIVCELIPYCCRYIYEFENKIESKREEIKFQNDGFSNDEIIKILKEFIKDKNELISFKTFYEEITKYRHFFTHNPGIDILNVNGKRLIVHRNYIDSCKSLSSLRELQISNPEYFINPIEQSFTDFVELMEVLNIIWGYFIIRIGEIKKNKKEEYFKLVRNK